MKRGPKPAIKTAASEVASSEPLTAPPAPPKALGTIGAQYWRRLAGELVAARILTRLHLDSLELLCRMFQEHALLVASLGKDPGDWFFESESGYELEKPQVRIVNTLRGRIVDLAARFGLTPDKQQQPKPQAAAQPASALQIFASRRG